ncbi:hypothetical protein ABS848_28480, partial [Klebsiella pneumoniae]|uniref:hypothetical protein n=1 Tax=Klebsiella pneumoniae TaxID=573 RepID=UPI003315802B
MALSAYWVEQGKGQRAYEPCGGLCESLSVLRAAEWRRPMRTPDGFHANTHIRRKNYLLGLEFLIVGISASNFT